MEALIYPAAAVLLGYVVLGITGFGSALMIVPLLAWYWPLVEVVPLVLLLDVPASLLLGGLNLRQVHWRELGRLLPGMVAGALLGLWLSFRLASHWPLLALGVYVAGVGVHRLWGQADAAPKTVYPAWVHGAGVLIGVVEMLFGTAGPLMVAWLGRRLASVQALRATTPLAITAGACAVLLTMAGAGRLSSPELWQRWLVLMAVAAVGVLVGHRAALRLPLGLLHRLICALLIVSGLSLVWHAVTG